MWNYLIPTASTASTLIFPSGRKYFARSPGSDIWVWFGDLPDAVRTALYAKR
jgi:hypothetical protein